MKHNLFIFIGIFVLLISFSFFNMFSFYSSKKDLNGFVSDKKMDFTSKTFSIDEINEIQNLLNSKDFVLLENKIRILYLKSKANSQRRELLVKLLARINEVKENKILFFSLLKDLENITYLPYNDVSKLIHTCIYSYFMENGTFPQNITDRISFINFLSSNCGINSSETKIKDFKVITINEKSYKFEVNLYDKRNFIFNNTGVSQIGF